VEISESNNGMKKVEVWGVDKDGNREKQGEITLDDQGKLKATDGIATAILHSASDDGNRRITKDEPDAFINSLTRRYKSPYLRVTKPM
jgi:hypothetical protein